MHDIVLFYPDGHEQHRQSGHPERPERIEAFCQGIREIGAWDLLEPIAPYPLPDGLLERVHSPAYLRRLEAMMIVADKEVSLVLTGTGDVLEPEQGVMAIGSGGNYALAAARALVDSEKDAETIVRRALDIAADICVYTNRNVTIESLASA